MDNIEDKLPIWVNFVASGSAGMLATCCVQPLDMLKIRMQLGGMGKKQRNQNTYHLFYHVVKTEGFLELYNGLSAALLRQASYTSIRIGGYHHLDQILTNHDISTKNFLTKVGMGLVTGAAGGLSCTPAEVAMIRMASDGQNRPDERRNYKHVFDALLKIYQGEGISGLWRGVYPTMGRAMLSNAVQLSTYFQLKEYLVSTEQFHDNLTCHFISSLLTGPVSTLFAVPIDIAKTRIQNTRIINGVPEYKTAYDVLSEVIRKEGITALWKGYTPYYLRIGPHATLTLIFLEYFERIYYCKIK